MSKGGEPRAKTIGKCVTCGLVVREGDEVFVMEWPYHKTYDEANQREIKAWNDDVRKDKEGRA